VATKRYHTPHEVLLDIDTARDILHSISAFAKVALARARDAEADPDDQRIASEHLVMMHALRAAIKRATE
jgi:hypothetical protein